MERVTGHEVVGLPSNGGAPASGLAYRSVYGVVGKMVDSRIEEGGPLYTVITGDITRGAEQMGLQISLSERQVQIP